MALSVPRLLPTKTYPFSDIRHTFAATGIQPGVVAGGATTEFKVTQDTGSNMNVKIAQGDSGAWVTGLDTTRQGAYHVYNDAIITTAVGNANGTNPRIDQVVLRVYDTNVIGGGTDAATIEVIAGTATSGATLDNRTGAANLATIAAPKSLIRLADILVPAASTAVTNANVRDRRPWARGALVAGSLTSGNITVSSGTFAQVSASLQWRVECSGVPIELTLMGQHQSQGGGASAGDFDVAVNGTRIGGSTNGLWRFQQSVASSARQTLIWRHVWTPSVGSALITIHGKVASDFMTIFASDPPLQWVIREFVGRNSSND